MALRLAKPKDVRILVAKGTREKEEQTKITDVLPISEKLVQQIEVQPIMDQYSYVRIRFDTIANEYSYEVIEPKLTDDEQQVLGVLNDQLIDNFEAQPFDATDKDREEHLRKEMNQEINKLGVRLSPVARERMFYYVRRNFIGYGLIEVPMRDKEVEDISCDGVGVPVYIYTRKYGSIRSNLKFTSDKDLDSFVVWLAQRCGKHISVAQPMLDATIPDGSRLQATLGKYVTKKGSSFTIRRFKEDPFTPLDLIRFKTMSIEMMAYLWVAIEHGQSMLICGGTASGKTTTLNAILLFIPPQMKIVSIEDTRELNLPHENWVPLLTRSGFGGKNIVTGKAAGEIDQFDLLTTALRQRPQYLMVGEVRGAEAYVVFQAMATGKTAYTTFHSDSVQAMVHRMESDPINLPRALIQALNIVLLQGQVRVSSKMTRRVKALTEIVGIDPETNELITNAAYSWNPADDKFNFSGHSYVYSKYAESKNWTMREMDREVKRRVILLKYMDVMNFRRHVQVASLISQYYRNSQEVIKEIIEVLKEKGIEESI